MTTAFWACAGGSRQPRGVSSGEVVEDAADGAWVTGLPGVVRLITVGQEFVSAGRAR
jgi:hypothetical protein